MIAERHRLENGRIVMFRDVVPADQGYIASSWVASVLNGPDMYFGPGRSQAVNAMVDRLLDDPATKILVACEPSDSDRILGWIAYAAPTGARVLLYVNVRHQARREGIGAELARRAGLARDGTPLMFLWQGPDAKWAMQKRPEAVKLDPKDYIR